MACLDAKNYAPAVALRSSAATALEYLISASAAARAGEALMKIHAPALQLPHGGFEVHVDIGDAIGRRRGKTVMR
jgi:hypothetical protein